MPTLTITYEAPDGSSEDVAVLTIDPDDTTTATVQDAARLALAETSWPSGTYLLGLDQDNAGTLEYVADHGRRHVERLPWLRCADVQCPVPDPLHAMVDRTAAVRAAAARDGRCHPDDAQALLELIEHSRDAVDALATHGISRGFMNDAADVMADLAVDVTRAATIANVGARILQAMVHDDDPMRWSNVLATAIERESRPSTWGGTHAASRAALRPHALDGLRAILSEMRLSVDARELLAVTAGVSFGGFELAYERERRERESAGVQG